MSAPIDISPPAPPPEGLDPDYRFSYANERTFLAWIRTALALIVGGLILAQIPSIADSGWRQGLVGVPPIVAAAYLAIHSHRDWGKAERAMRLTQPLPLANRPRTLLVGFLITWSACAAVATLTA